MSPRVVPSPLLFVCYVLVLQFGQVHQQEHHQFAYNQRSESQQYAFQKPQFPQRFQQLQQPSVFQEAQMPQQPQLPQQPQKVKTTEIPVPKKPIIAWCKNANTKSFHEPAATKACCKRNLGKCKHFVTYHGEERYNAGTFCMVRSNNKGKKVGECCEKQVIEAFRFVGKIEAHDTSLEEKGNNPGEGSKIWEESRRNIML